MLRTGYNWLVQVAPLAKWLGSVQDNLFNAVAKWFGKSLNQLG